MKKDLKPLIEAGKKIDYFLKKYPDTDYATDLKFKKFNIKSTCSKGNVYSKILYFNSKMGSCNK